MKQAFFLFNGFAKYIWHGCTFLCVHMVAVKSKVSWSCPGSVNLMIWGAKLNNHDVFVQKGSYETLRIYWDTAYFIDVKMNCCS